MTLDTIIERKVGRFSVKAEKVLDDSPDFSYLGAFKPNMVWNPITFTYDRDTDLMYDGSKWRNAKGQIQAEPENLDYTHRDGCRFIDIGSCQFNRGDSDALKMAFENARLLTRIDEDWQYVGIVATVEMNGREIGSAACYGFEDAWYGPMAKDSEKYLKLEAKSIVREAIDDARTFIEGVCA